MRGLRSLTVQVGCATLPGERRKENKELEIILLLWIDAFWGEVRIKIDIVIYIIKNCATTLFHKERSVEHNARESWLRHNPDIVKAAAPVKSRPTRRQELVKTRQYRLNTKMLQERRK